MDWTHFRNKKKNQQQKTTRRNMELISRTAYGNDD